MKIGVDIRVLMDRQYSGVAEYTANLLQGILEQDTANDYRLFYNSFHNLDDKLGIWRRPNASVRGTHIPNKIFNYFLQKTLGYPKLDQILGGVDIFWSPHFNFSRLSWPETGLKKIITVHDLSFLRYPEFFNARKNFWHRALAVKKTLRAAAAIVAVSDNTKNDIIELAGVAPDKIRVIYSGNNLRPREISAAEKQEFLTRHKLSGRFILYLGNIEPRKNIVGLIKAFERLKKTSHFKPDLKLVLAGAKGWKSREIYQTRTDSPNRDDIIFLGYVSKKDQEILYSLASVLAYPSYYEGFGFPPLEAMSCGLPLVCSNNSSLPEVVGDAAVLINPFKVEEIAGALEAVLNDEALRQDLIRRGYERARLFSWNQAAREYLDLFKNIYGK